MHLHFWGVFMDQDPDLSDPDFVRIRTQKKTRSGYKDPDLKRLFLFYENQLPLMYCTLFIPICLASDKSCSILLRNHRRRWAVTCCSAGRRGWGASPLPARDSSTSSQDLERDTPLTGFRSRPVMGLLQEFFPGSAAY